jgi:hypothetical protein
MTICALTCGLAEWSGSWKAGAVHKIGTRYFVSEGLSSVGQMSASRATWVGVVAVTDNPRQM